MEALKPKLPAPTWRDEAYLLVRPAALLLGCLAAAGIALGISGWLRADAADTLADARQARAASASRLHHVGIEQQELNQFGAQFERLRAGGMIGDENRLRWIEAIKASQAGRKLVSADYEIAPQQAVGGAAPLLPGDYHVRASRMRLQLGMVHELDLFNTLSDLRAAGPYTVQDCQIKRNDVPPDAIGVARLTANCTLIWPTLGAAPAAAPAPMDKAWP